MKPRFVYAVILRKYSLCNPTTEAIMSLKASREATGVRKKTRERYDNVDSLRPFYTYYNPNAFSITGVTISNGKMWLFRSRKKAEAFQSGFFAYKIFLGECMAGEHSV